MILILVEVFIPGIIVGLTGFASLIVAAVLCYVNYGPDAGNKLLLGELIFGVVFVAWWLKYLPTTRFARLWTLHAKVEGGSQDTPSVPTTGSLVHQTGQAVTPLRPAGIAVIEGQRLDVVTAGEFVPAGEPIEVVKVEGNRVVVRRSVSL